MKKQDEEIGLKEGHLRWGRVRIFVSYVKAKKKKKKIH